MSRAGRTLQISLTQQYLCTMNIERNFKLNMLDTSVFTNFVLCFNAKLTNFNDFPLISF